MIGRMNSIRFSDWLTLTAWQTDNRLSINQCHVYGNKKLEYFHPAAIKKVFKVVEFSFFECIFWSISEFTQDAPDCCSRNIEIFIDLPVVAGYKSLPRSPLVSETQPPEWRWPSPLWWPRVSWSRVTRICHGFLRPRHRSHAGWHRAGTPGWPPWPGARPSGGAAPEDWGQSIDIITIWRI